MIFKFRILLAAVLLSISQLQSGQDKGIKTLCDINGCRFMEIMSDVETGSEKYRYISQEDTVELAWADNIEFKYGKDSLYDYIAKKYYEYYLATEMEFNAMVFIHVIFDRELHIIDIKNMSGNREDSSMRDIDSLFKTAIIRTENCWHFVSPPDDKQEYFLVLIPYRIY